MTVANHEPEWPDKIMFAALTLVVGGALGAGFAALEFTSASVDKSEFVILEAIHPGWSLAFSAATTAFGLLGLRYQATRWIVLGALSAILSFGFIGMLPFLGLIAVYFAIKSKLEGEETRHDATVMHASEWPDKAIAASMLLTVGGLVTFLHGAMALSGRMEAVYGTPALGWVMLATGVYSMYAARSCFRLKNRWSGWTAAALHVLLLGFYLVGPVVGGVALVLMMLADREAEFVTEAASAESN